MCANQLNAHIQLNGKSRKSGFMLPMYKRFSSDSSAGCFIFIVFLRGELGLYSGTVLIMLLG